MTDEKKDDKDRKKLSDEELEDVAGGKGTIFEGSKNIEIRHGDSKNSGGDWIAEKGEKDG